MSRDTLDFETIKKALNQSYELLQKEEWPSETALQKLQEAKDLLNNAINYSMERDRSAI